jgi:uncharacterized iron-regulated membrane protein
MKLAVLNRRVHSWGSILIAVPLLFIIGSGILLLLKKDISWIQPETIQGAGVIPVVSFDQILKAAASVQEAEIRTWADIKRIDVQPAKGVAKITTSSNYEVQIDIKTARILSAQNRRSDVIESIHDGSFLHDNVKYYVSLPSGIILFILLITGVVLFFHPYYVKYKRSAKRRTARAA